MPVVHMSEAEAASNFATLLQHVRHGLEVVIEDGQTEIARIIPSAFPEPGEDPAYDSWFADQVQEGLDCDLNTDIDGRSLEAEFVQRRAETLRKLQEQPGGSCVSLARLVAT